MTFQIKDFASIVAAQINHARAVSEKLTDFAPGSAARTIMEAPAIEMEELYLQMFLGLRDAIPVATFRSFGFTRLEPAFARGFVTITADAPLARDLTVYQGAEFTASSGAVYKATKFTQWLQGSSVIRFPVIASVIGSAGNIIAGGINQSADFPASGGFTVSNLAITTGRDLETDAEREVRFAAFVAALSRGTLAACRFAAAQSVVLDADGLATEYVTRTGLIEEPGHVRIYVRGSGGDPSDALLADGQARIDGTSATPGYRAAGVRVDVLPMAERAVSGAFQVGMLAGYTLDAATRIALADVFASQIASIDPGETLYLGALVEALLAVDGVATVVPQSLSNITCAQTEALAAGSFSATAL